MFTLNGVPLGIITAMLALAPAFGAAGPASAAGTIERVSVGLGGVQGDGYSNFSAPAVSADGRLVAFVSGATNLVPNDTNGAFDVFVRDRRKRVTTRVSVGPGGAQGDSSSSPPAISAGGRFVAFGSDSTNLVPGDTNGVDDVFVHDRKSGRTTRVNLGPRGQQADGGSDSRAVAISADGRVVAFTSYAANLVPGDSNGRLDVFVRDLKKNRTVRVSVGSGGTQGDDDSFDPALSADGRVVAFVSDATNLVPRDTNRQRDVFVRDLASGETRRASVGPGGAQGDRDNEYLAISADGRVVAFTSYAANLVPGDSNGAQDVFVRDLARGTTALASLGRGGAQGDGDSLDPGLSADGRAVAFDSEATNLVPGDTNGDLDVFVRTR